MKCLLGSPTKWARSETRQVGRNKEREVIMSHSPIITSVEVHEL